MDSVRKQRDVRLDFFRGLALASIFINHIPGNIYEHLTHRNFGFSDAAELFVFLAGFVAAMAYFGRFVAGDALGQSYRALKRAGQLYMAQTVSVIACIAVFAAAAIYFGDPEIAGRNNIQPILDDPAKGLLGVALMVHHLGYFNILPMYVVMLAMLPLVMWLARIDFRLALAASGALYLSVHLFGINMPEFPNENGWFFNPLAWQFLFTIGFVAGAMAKSGNPVPYHPVAYALGALWLAIGAAWAMSGFWFDEQAVLPWPQTLFGFSKTHEGLWRLTHVLALAYVVAWSPLGAWLKTAIRHDNVIAVMGRHGLPIFCAGSLLSMVAMLWRDEMGGGLLTDTVLVGGGLAIQIALAQVMEWNRNRGREAALAKTPAKPARPALAAAR